MLPLLHLAQGCAPPSGILVLDLVSEAENRNGIAYGHLDLACFEALAKHTRRAAQARSARRHLSCPWGQGRKGTFIHGGTLVPGASAGVPAAPPVG